MDVYTQRVTAKADRLKWKAGFVSALAAKFSIPGASEPSLSRAFRNLKALPTTETAVPLNDLLGRFEKMAERLRPFDLVFEDPGQAAELLEQFENGALEISVTRNEKSGALVHSVYIIELLRDRTFFNGMESGVPRKANYLDVAMPIRDATIANVAADTLDKTGYPCRVVAIRLRVDAGKIAGSLADLGFITETGVGGDDGQAA